MDRLTTLNLAQHCISVLTTIEIRSAIRRLETSDEIASADATRAVQRLESELMHLQLIAVSDEVLSVSRRVTDSSTLRALDSMQLATALLIGKADGNSPFTLVASDRKLLQAARASGLAILNPED